MADVKNADKRFPDPWTHFKFPYGGCRFSTLDGSGEWFYEKNGQVMTLKYHAPSGTMEYTTGSGDNICINKGNAITYNMSGETITTEGGATDIKRMSVRSIVAGGEYFFRGGDMHTYTGGDNIQITLGNNNEANEKGKYTGTKESERSNIGKDRIADVAGNDTETIKKSKATVVTENISVDTTSGSIVQTAAVNHTTNAGGVNTVQGEIVVIGG